MGWTRRSSGLIMLLVRAIIVSLFFSVSLGNCAVDINENAAPILQRDATSLKSPIEHIRREPTLSSNSTSGGNSTLSEAEKIVKAALEEAKIRNKYLREHPRLNQRIPRPESPPGGEAKLTPEGVPLGTGLNETVREAAATVAHELALRNSTAIDDSTLEKRQASTYWMANMVQNGASPFTGDASYQVWRNVKDYGAVGDGVTDDTDAINAAVSDGNRCGEECGSSSTLYAVVYFPPGTYLVSAPIIQYYITQFIGNPLDRPIIKAAPSFAGLGMISSDVYIEGGDGAQWYINQSNFYRQLRNFILDISGAPLDTYPAAIHWQVAQATSLQNVKFIMSSAPGTTQQGIFMENGSGGFLSDLEFEGGAVGAYVGNQQFTVRNLQFRNQQERALQIHWDWGWTWKGVDIADCPVGIQMITWDSLQSTEVGSAIFIDSKMTNVGTGVLMQQPSETRRISLSLFSLEITNVPTVVSYFEGDTLLAGTTGSSMIAAWGIGKRYDTSQAGEEDGVWQDGENFPRAPEISGVLLKDESSQTSGFFERSKPQYENVPASQFSNIKLDFGAAGDGQTDDTAALNSAFQSVSQSGKILWIPAGVYIVTDTVLIPPGVKVVGQAWSQIMGMGQNFATLSSPYPVVKVGNKGDVGDVEIQDMIFTVKGATAGAVVIEWNIKEASKGSAAMWDAHVRIGGAKGSDLQVGNCPKLTGQVDEDCIAGSMLIHITAEANGYFENTWFWVADHDLDIPAQTQIDVFVGRGLLVESSGPVWLYGTGSEHCVLYQYQTLNAANIFMGMIQTEAPYYQGEPQAPAPFNHLTYDNDPEFEYCDGSDNTCGVAWGVRFINSESIYLYGAGLYSWFSEYDQLCVAQESCQDRIFEIKGSSDIWIYSLITKASLEMISPYNGLAILGEDNQLGFVSIIMAWLGSADGTGSENPNGLRYRSPESATVIPFPASTPGPAETFTIGAPVNSDILTTPFDGDQNEPQGPGADECDRCDLMRIITSTCCGTGGGVSNPIEIAPHTPTPGDIILPKGFIPNQRVEDPDTGFIYIPGEPLPEDVIIPAGTILPYPLIIPAGSPLTDTYTPDNLKDNPENETLYIYDDFWDPDHDRTVYCYYPCTIALPPSPTSKIWMPSPFTTVFNGTITSTSPPVQSTQKISISTITVSSSTESSNPTVTVTPEARDAPLCVEFTIPFLDITFKFGLCPPEIHPPPPIPPITIYPPPPGKTPGPIYPFNTPPPADSDAEEEDEEEDEEEEELCAWLPPYDPTSQDTGWPGGGAFNPDIPSIYDDMDDPPEDGAGKGTPTTTTRVVTVTATATETEDVVTTVYVPGTPEVEPDPEPEPEPEPRKPTYNFKTERSKCFRSGLHTDGQYLDRARDYFCSRFFDVVLEDREYVAIEFPALQYQQIDIGVYGTSNCRFQIGPWCESAINLVIHCTANFFTDPFRSGGTIDSNCAHWVIDPNHNGEHSMPCARYKNTGECVD